MPRELPPHFSPRWSDTGPNLGYHIDPLLNAEVIAFFFFWFMQHPLRKRPKCQEKCWFDTQQPSFFHGHTSGWIILNGVLPESCCAKVCCIYLFWSLSWLLRTSFLFEKGCSLVLQFGGISVYILTQLFWRLHIWTTTVCHLTKN